MQPKFNYITLGVNNLDKSLSFYRDGLGWPTNGIVGTKYHDKVTGADGTIAFFKLEGGILLGLYERTNLAKDAGVALDSPSSTEFSLGYQVDSKEVVDETLQKAHASGAVLTRPAHMRPFGVYSGYFKDPDGHLWEVAWSENS